MSDHEPRKDGAPGDGPGAPWPTTTPLIESIRVACGDHATADPLTYCARCRRILALLVEESKQEFAGALVHELSAREMRTYHQCPTCHAEAGEECLDPDPLSFILYVCAARIPGPRRALMVPVVEPRADRYHPFRGGAS